MIARRELCSVEYRYLPDVPTYLNAMILHSKILSVLGFEIVNFGVVNFASDLISLAG